jgi:hypothetical protein
MTDTNPTLNAITANTALIKSRLMRASALVAEAHEAALRGEQNLAVGTLTAIGQDIADTQALLKTVFVLHRSRAEF